MGVARRAWLGLSLAAALLMLAVPVRAQAPGASPPPELTAPEKAELEAQYDKLFAELKLPALVPMRSNGLYAMVKRMQAIAKAAAVKEPSGETAARTLPIMPLRARPRDGAKRLIPIASDGHVAPFISGGSMV